MDSNCTAGPGEHKNDGEAIYISVVIPRMHMHAHARSKAISFVCIYYNIIHGVQHIHACMHAGIVRVHHR